MNSLLLEVNWMAGSGLVLLILFIVLGALAGLGGIFSTIARWVLVIKYKKYNRQKIQNGVTSEQAARAFLDANGLNDVKVEKSGWAKSMFVGNVYNVRKNTIYLRSNVYGKSTVTAIGMALQKVTQAIEYKKNNDQKVKAKSGFQTFMLFSPIFIIPLMLVGLVLDFVFFKEVGYLTIVASGVSLVFYILAFVAALLNLKVEVRANEKTVEMLEHSNLMTPDEITALEGVYKAYKIAYIAEFVTAMIRMLYEILKLIFKILALVGRKK